MNSQMIRAKDDAHVTRENQLLAQLPLFIWQRWLPQLESVDMPLAAVLVEEGSTPDHVYFPTTAIVSLLYMTESGESTELAVIGREGLVGIALVMGGGSTPARAVVQTAGRGYRLTAKSLKAECDENGPVLHLLLRYTQALTTQMSQTAVCNRYHSSHQQLCRWLLLSLDRARSRELVTTHALISQILGLRRETVTTCAQKLQEQGLIHYQRGSITVLDRPGIEACSCECYSVVKREYDRLLPAMEAV